MSDLETANAALADEASLLTTLVAQAAGGDANAKMLLVDEITAALQMRSIYVGAVSGVDTQALDNAVQQARVVTGQSAGGAGGTSSGLRLGTLVIPWAGVIAVVVFVGLALYVTSRKGKR